MKIRVAILAKDKNYLTKITNVFGSRYSDKVEIYSFTEQEYAIAQLSEVKADVFLADSIFEIKSESLPLRCALAYLADSPDITTINNYKAICKFQKSDLLYKEILNLYSTISSVNIFINNDCKMILFSSACGGCGTSTTAAACALHYAAKGQKTLYLNLEKFGNSEIFFSGEGQFDMSDIIFALKSQKANLALKLESCVRQDPSGVFFFASPKIALDMTELNVKDIKRLLSTLKLSSSYDCIVVDYDFGLDSEHIEVFNEMHSIVIVNDGSYISNIKTAQLDEAIAVLDRNSDIPISSRMVLMYNRFGSSGKMLENCQIKSIGAINKYVFTEYSQLLKQLQTMDIFDKII